ncbi:KilA-N domain-containing protein [Klebsiella aerogenes]|uniref:KilA-N domain-containing protein n=1 Tax=Klebsiella aerogenes TaxID=548 RepID=UPI003750C96A
MTRKMITLRFNNAAHIISSDEEGMFSLKELWLASGLGEAKKPNRWTRSNGEFLKRQIWRNKSGRYGGTWANEQVVFAYAEWLSIDFHTAVIEAFTALANNDVKKAKEIVRTAVRVEGIPVRKEVASKIMKYGDKTFISDMTDLVNLTVTGKTAKGLKATRTEGFNKSTPTRDRMVDMELKAVTAIEALVAVRIENSENGSDWLGRSSVREIVSSTCSTVRSMIS